MNDTKTQYFIPIEPKSASLLIVDRNKLPFCVELNGDMTFGRDYQGSDRDIRVYSEIVGRKHGEFIYDNSNGDYYYIDNNSLNGTYINGRKLPPYNERGSKAVKLCDGDIIRIDRSNLNFPHPAAVLMVFSRSFDSATKWYRMPIWNDAEITIGRSADNSVPLDDMMVSRRHALIKKCGDAAYIYDCNSQNGLFVNKMPIGGGTRLFDNDVIRMAHTLLIYSGDFLYYNNLSEHTFGLSVNIRRKAVNMGRKTLIRDIGFDAESGDFILILGGSGAGKTTLVNAILGDGKAEGTVLLDGMDLYDNFKTLKSRVGIVPQFLNLRANDKVKQTLLDIADIKLDRKEYSKQDKIKRINDIMEKLGIGELQNHLISQLSGGQKKKVSVAAQLVGFQQVFICDEPDSGLDGASRRQQMQILKEIADNKKIVMVISHEPNDAVSADSMECLFTKVLVLAKDSKENCGRLAFYGTPNDALNFFGVTNLQDITAQINPVHEGGLERADYYINKFNAMRQALHGRYQ